MGARGRRSAADLATIRPEREFVAIDFDRFFSRGGYSDRREAERALLRAERSGQATRRAGPDGTTEWYGTAELVGHRHRHVADYRH